MRLPDRVIILDRSAEADEYGEETLSYSEGREVYANVEVAPGSESRVAGRSEESTSVDVTLRTPLVESEPLGHKDRLRYRGDDLQVQALENDRRSGFTTLYCTRVRS
jgi:head-tail adaptor